MPAAKKTAKKSTKSTANKASATKSAATRKKMAQSQQARRAVSNYLDALHAPKCRGRKVSVETLKQRLREAEAKARQATGIARLDAMKTVHELDQRIKTATATTGQDLKALEAAFVKHARGYADRKGIPYDVWRRAGVPPTVLAKAGVKRSPA